MDWRMREASEKGENSWEVDWMDVREWKVKYSVLITWFEMQQQLQAKLHTLKLST